MNIETLAPYLVGLIGLCGSFIGLLGVGLGALISYLNNRQNIQAQAKQREEDREEQEREAKIQTKEKWIERDILAIMDSIDNILKLLAVYKTEIQNEKFDERLADNNPIKLQLNQARDSLSRLVYSFGDEIISSYEDFSDSILEFLKALSEKVYQETELLNKRVERYEKLIEQMTKENNKEKTESYIKEREEIENMNIEVGLVENEIDTWLEVRYAAGNFQKFLREMLISIRDE